MSAFRRRHRSREGDRFVYSAEEGNRSVFHICRIRKDSHYQSVLHGAELNSNCGEILNPDVCSCAWQYAISQAWGVWEVCKSGATIGSAYMSSISVNVISWDIPTLIIHSPPEGLIPAVPSQEENMSRWPLFAAWTLRLVTPTTRSRWSRDHSKYIDIYIYISINIYIYLSNDWIYN